MIPSYNRMRISMTLVFIVIVISILVAASYIGRAVFPYGPYANATAEQIREMVRPECLR